MYEFKTVLSFLYDPADGRVAVYGIHFLFATVVCITRA